jgi:hypothetical protein
MPYFKRQPYAVMTGRGPEPDVMTLAREVLAADAAARNGAPFRPRAPVPAGTLGQMTLDFALDDAGAPVDLRLEPGDLAGPGGRIPAACVRVAPAALAVAPGAPAAVMVTVAVPPGMAPGRYAGALAVTGGDGFAVPIEVEVP